MTQWVTDMKRSRRSMNILGKRFGTRTVHHATKRFDKETQKVVTGYVTEEVDRHQHDIYAHGKRNFWRGACLA